MDAFFNEKKNGRLINRLFQIKYTHNNPFSHWLGYHNKLYNSKDNTEFAKLTREIFQHIINQLSELKFINLSLYRLCDTVWGRQEFIAMPEKI